MVYSSAAKDGRSEAGQAMILGWSRASFSMPSGTGPSGERR